MGKGGSLAAAALLLFLGGLGVAYGSGHGEADPDCTTVRWQPTQELQGGTRWCPDAGLPSLGGTFPLPVLEPQDQDPHNATLDPCQEQGRIGYELSHNGNRSFVCLSFQYEHPTNFVLPAPDGQAASVGVEDCEAPDIGWIFEVSYVWVGACLQYELVTPTRFDNPNPRFSADDCDVATTQGADPAVFVYDGGFAFCVGVVFHVVNPEGPDEPPPIGYDLEPCSRHGVDPAVRIDDGGFFVCVEVKIHW